MNIELTDRLCRIPSLNYLLNTSTRVYDRIKETNTIVNWTFDLIENMANVIIEKSLPLARLIDKPIYTLDKILCQGLDFMAVRLPIIKEESKEILNRTKSIISCHFYTAIQIVSALKQETKQKVKIMTLLTYYKVHYLRSYSWQQADRVMSTETGISILKTVDSTTDFVELILDKYLPVPQEEMEEDTEVLCSERDKLHHTMERLSEFSNRVSRRIYLALMERSQHMYKIELIIIIFYVLIVIQTVKMLTMFLAFIFKSFNNCVSFFLAKLRWYKSTVREISQRPIIKKHYIAIKQNVISKKN